MRDSDQAVTLVMIAYFHDSLEADLLASKLVTHGIDAQVEPHAAYGTFTQVPVGFHPRGIGVLVPQAQADQADRIWQQRRDANAQRKTAESNLERSCRRTLFFSLGGCFVVGPLVVLTLFHIHGLSKRLTAEGESLSEDERGACARYLSNARVACIATSVIGTWIWVMLAYVLVMLASAA